MSTEIQRQQALSLIRAGDSWWWELGTERGRIAEGTRALASREGLLTWLETLLDRHRAQWEPYMRMDKRWGWRILIGGEMEAHSTEGWRDRGVASYQMGRAFLMLRFGLAAWRRD